jgi:L-lactate permease
MMGIWPAILVTGATFALSQFLVSNYIGPELVDVIAAIALIVALVAFLKVWQPKTIWTSTSLTGRVDNSRDDIVPLEATGVAASMSEGATRGKAQSVARTHHSRLDAVGNPHRVRLGSAAG